MTINKAIIPALLISSSIAGCKQATERPPNIILIVADDMGYGDLGCYGNEIIKTPHIDKLAKEGIRFTQNYAGSAVSSPSRCALLTGKHTGHTTIRDNFAREGGLPGFKNESPIRRMSLLPEDTTIGTMLKTAGYTTCVVNKWHLDGFNPGGGPLDRGFDEFYGWLISTENSNTPYYYPELRFRNRDLTVVPENENGARAIHGTDLSINESIDFIERNKEEPFFLFLAFDTPHEPYFINSVEPYASSPISETAKRYAALITHADEAIGRLITYLEENNLRDNTLIIFTSDNGGAVQAPLDELNCNAGLRGRKGLLYEGGIKVPLIVNFPGKIEPNQERNEVIYFPDIMPTLAEYAGAETPPNIDGISLKALFEGGEISNDRTLYWEFPGKQAAIRQGNWKAVSVDRDAGFELFDIGKDPNEVTDLAVQHPDILARLKKEIGETRAESPYWPTK
jgi:arylsulfatase A-like enzyme